MDILTTPSTCPNCLTLDDKINKIISIEWAMFDAVNKGKEVPRAACQEDPVTFELMRRAQFEAWSAPMIDSYLADLLVADAEGKNLVERKYLYMMCGPNLESMLEQSGLADHDTTVLVDRIMEQMNAWNEQLIRNFPALAEHSRPLHSSEDTEYETSMETYERCELYTYSITTLRLFDEYIQELRTEKKNLPHMIIRNTYLLQAQMQDSQS